MLSRRAVWSQSAPRCAAGFDSAFPAIPACVAPMPGVPLFIVPEHVHEKSSHFTLRRTATLRQGRLHGRRGVSPQPATPLTLHNHLVFSDVHVPPFPPPPP